MALADIIPTLTWRDLVDIIFLSLVAYQFYVWFKGTKALRVLVGLVVLGGIYSLAKFWGLFMTTWAFQVLWQVLVILLLILFQAEIRQVLEKVSPLRYLRARRDFSETVLMDDLAGAVFDLARDRVGAIVVLARNDNPAEFVRAGHPVMALPTPALIKSIFNPGSPAHDGAVTISRGRLTEMGCFLPLTEREDLPEEYGTRHRAAIGLCEHVDSICLIVSEERGEVSTVAGREIRVWESPKDLAAHIKDRLGLAETPGPSLKGFLKGVFIENWGVKTGALILVTLVWLILAGAQNLNMTINASIDFTGPPLGSVLSEDTVTQVRLQLSGPRRQVVNLKGYEVKVRVDLRGLSLGPHLIRLSAQNVELPLGLTIDRVWPQNIKVTLKPGKTRTPAPLVR